MEDPMQAVTPLPLAKEATNATTKFTPTPQDMACAYLSLMIMALVPIFVGSFKSIRYQKETQARVEETGEQAEAMTVRDAAMFPLIASCALFGFYILINISPELVNLALSGYFFLLGAYAIYRIIRPLTNKILPSKYNSTQYTLLFGSRSLDQSSEHMNNENSSSSNTASKSGNKEPTGSYCSEGDLVPTEVMLCTNFTPSDILAFILAGALGVWYIFTKHWVANNAFGLAFALNGIELLPINTVRIGCILLCGLFFYDVFWVFGTDVMVSVAKKFDAPIKIVFPQDFLISGLWGKNFAMLGLGDIVIPGIFIAFLLRFDQSLNRRSNLYFWSCFLAYIFGLGLTIGIMSYFKHAQPALLYLVPCCILIPLLVAILRGDLKALLNYCDHPLPLTTDDPVSSNDATDEGDDEAESKNDKIKSRRSISTRASSKKEN